MNPKSDEDLKAIFAQARRCDQEDAPAWRPELLDGPRRPSSAGRRMLAVLVAASVIVMAVFLSPRVRHEPTLSEVLPPLFDSPPGELFASVEPSLLTFEAPSDFLLPDHSDLSIP